MAKGKTVSRQVPENESATLEEVRSAFEALTQTDLVALKKFSLWRIVRIGAAAEGRTYEDLMNEAFEAVFSSGRRRWKKDSVSFFNFLKGAIRSISSNWAAKSKRHRTLLASNLTDDLSNNHYSSPVADASVQSEEREGVVLVRQIKGKLEELVSDHSIRKQVLAAWEIGMIGSEIQQECGITKREYDAARQWVYRAKMKLAAEVKRHESNP